MLLVQSQALWGSGLTTRGLSLRFFLRFLSEDSAGVTEFSLLGCASPFRLMTSCTAGSKNFFEIDAQTADRIGKTDEQHRLPDAAKQIDDLGRLGAQIDVTSVEQEVVIAAILYEIREARVQFIREEAKYSAYLLQGDAASTKLFNDENVDQVLCGIDAKATETLRHDDTTLIPPLQLTGGDPGQRRNLARAETPFGHRGQRLSKHFVAEMFEDIFALRRAAVNEFRMGAVNSTYSWPEWFAAQIRSA